MDREKDEIATIQLREEKRVASKQVAMRPSATGTEMVRKSRERNYPEMTEMVSVTQRLEGSWYGDFLSFFFVVYLFISSFPGSGNRVRDAG